MHQNTRQAHRVIKGLFDAFYAKPRLMPAEHAAAAKGAAKAVVIADYIAGMTDRYALEVWGQTT